MRRRRKTNRRATLLLMVVGLLATLFLIISAYITLARFDNLALESTRKAEVVDDILDSLNSVVLSAMVQSWADADGNLLAGGREDPGSSSSDVLDTYGPDDLLGDRATRWLAGPEPVRDRSITDAVADGDPVELVLYKQTVSSFAADQSSSNQVAFAGNMYGWTIAAPRGLMLESTDDEADTVFDYADVLRNVRRPFMDADADGVSDSFFVATAPLTEIANAVADVAVRAPGADFDPSAIGDPDFDVNAALWRRFDDQARYEVAVKIISNGGLVALTSPGGYAVPGSVWNRQFVTEMFNWVVYRGSVPPFDLGPLRYTPDANNWFNELWSSAPAVEPYLRHRGGVLAQYTTSAVPTALRGRVPSLFPHTLWPTYTSASKAQAWQRFNLASMVQGGNNEWLAWRDGLALDADDFNATHQGEPTADPSPNYVRRHLLTTISNSDELAREVDPLHPNFDPAVPGIDKDMGTYPGQLKFYLGDIARAFEANGHYVLDDYVGGVARGNKVVQRLANCFYEMLADYKGWSGSGSPTEAVSRRQQAFMLAVNTVAFAAPRTVNPYSGAGGFVDAVWYTDTDASGGPLGTYVGYAPQPFITQVIAYCEGDEELDGEEDDGQPARKALAVELFNPNDPSPDMAYPTDVDLKFAEGADPFALDLTQFAISINAGALHQLSLALVNSQLHDAAVVPALRRLAGRNFMVISFDSGWDASPLRSRADGQFQATSFTPIDQEGKRVVEVKLWRQGTSGLGGSPSWFLVDQMTVGDLPGKLIPNQVSSPGQSENYEEEWWVDYHRDTRHEVFLRADWNGDGVLNPFAPAPEDAPARWRIAANLRNGESSHPQTFFTIQGRSANLGNAQEMINSSFHGPCTPLYTMNAGSTAGGAAVWSLSGLPEAFFTNTPIHGAYRPKSFPTVGFMLFVPRFSHSISAVLESVPMSERLQEQWEEWDASGSLDAGTGVYPADFGHMPIFDNNQEVDADSYFDEDKAGRIPWGLLVYDYFTTLDPNADYDGDGQADIDPRRVPGRVNINTAPWYVLAGLPIINPYALGNAADSTSPDPAFWSTTSGVLVGQVAAPEFATLPGGRLYRFYDPTVPSTSLFGWDGGSSWYRLGPYLGQAIASYRDRIRYTSHNVASNVLNPLWAADRRNNRFLDNGTADPIDPFAHSLGYRREQVGGPVPLFGGYAYGKIRRDDAVLPTDPSRYKRGFLSLGELLNVKGFDSPVYNGANPGNSSVMYYNPLGKAPLQLTYMPDFFKAVSLMALLDTHFLVTRSNTFTVYMTLTDRDPDRQQASVRTQYTVDRSNLLPELVVDDNGDPLMQDTDGLDPDGDGDYRDSPIIIQHRGLPEIVTRREVGYYDTQFDQ